MRKNVHALSAMCIAVLLLSSALIVGCGGSGGGAEGGTEGGAEGEGEDGGGTELVTYDDVRIIEDIEEVAFSHFENSDTQEIIVFDIDVGAESPIEEGDIVVGLDDGGYLRRVTRVSQQGQQLTLETEPASLSDAIAEGKLEFSVDFAQDDFTRAGISRTRSGVPSINLDGIELLDSIDVELSGEFSFTPKLDFTYDFEGGELEYIRLIVGGDLYLDFAVDVSTPLTPSSVDFERQIAPTITHPFAFFVGIWPVAGYIDLRLYAGISGGAEGSTQLGAGFTTTTMIEIGAEYVNGQWENVSSIGIDPELQGPIWEYETDLGVMVYLRPELRVIFYGVAGPEISAIPYVDVIQAVSASPSLFEVSAGIDGQLGFSIALLEIIDSDLSVGYTHTFKGPSFVLFSETTVGGGPDLTVSSNAMSLSSSSPSDGVVVTNIGTATLSWAALSSDPRLTVSPSSFTGNSRTVDISASEFDESFDAQVTFMNDSDSLDKEVVIVSILADIPDLPDLIVSDITLDSAAIYADDPLGFTYTVENIGAADPVTMEVFAVAGYLSTDAVLDSSDTILPNTYSAWTFYFYEGWSYTLTDSGSITGTTPGTYYLIVDADTRPGNPYPGVVEANEDNNWRAIQFTVLAP